MLNNTATEAKYNITVVFDGTAGVKGGVDGQSCFAETIMRLEIVGVGPANVISIQGKIRNSFNWYEITTATGAITGTIDISTYDFIRYVVTTADGVGELYASGYLFTNPGSVSLSGTFSMSGLRKRLKMTNMTVGDSAIAIPAVALSQRNSIIVENRDSVESVFIGEADVTASGAFEGWQLSPTSFYSTDITDAIVLYAIAPAGKSVVIKIMELA